jgi:hypothetical protein
MVSPAPVPGVAPKVIWLIPYAERICCGVYPTGVAPSILMTFVAAPLRLAPEPSRSSPPALTDTP